MIIVSHFSLRRRREIKHLHFSESMDRRDLNRAIGLAQKAILQSRIAEKMAERAFTLSSSANVATSILSKSLGTRPKFISKEQLVKDEVVKEQLADLFGKDEAEYLKPLLDDDEVELLEQARKQYEKAKSKGEVL
jgi:hypothetical protein